MTPLTASKKIINHLLAQQGIDCKAWDVVVYPHDRRVTFYLRGFLQMTSAQKAYIRHKTGARFVTGTGAQLTLQF